MGLRIDAKAEYNDATVEAAAAPTAEEQAEIDAKKAAISDIVSQRITQVFGTTYVVVIGTISLGSELVDAKVDFTVDAEPFDAKRMAAGATISAPKEWRLYYKESIFHDMDGLGRLFELEDGGALVTGME